MFRYIGLSWDARSTAAVSTAARLVPTLRGQEGWEHLLDRAGMFVSMRGATKNVNDVYRLGRSGVILGKLFPRLSSTPDSCSPATLTDREVDRILQGGGAALITSYWGRYVAFFASSDGSPQVILDPTGTLPCFRVEHEGVWVTFSWLEDVFAIFPQLPRPPIDWECLKARFQFGELWGRQTALEGVTRVLPGERIGLHHGKLQSDLLWNPGDFARAALHASPADAAARLHETVRLCSRAWAGCYERILLRLSGGVDSAILLGCLSGSGSPTDITCLNYHSTGPDSDERSYARLGAAKAGVKLIERERDGAFRLERLLDVARTPTPVHYIGRMGSAQMDAAEASARNASAIFTGGGGDQVFFEFPTWWPAADYLSVRGPDRGFAGAAMATARLAKLSVWRTIKLARNHRSASPFVWEAPAMEFIAWDTAGLPGPSERPRYTHPAVLAADSLPIGKRNQVFQLTYPIGYYDPHLTEAAPETVNPFLSQPIVELCLSLPTYLLTHGGRGRGLARRAFAAELPPEIAQRRSKGGIDDHVKGALLRSVDFVRSILLDGELVRRGILDRTKLDKALRGDPADLRAYCGELHSHIAVEAWIRAQQRSGPLAAATA